MISRLHKYQVTFGFSDSSGEYQIITSRPISANTPEEAETQLKQQFEHIEGTPCNIIKTEQIF